MMRRHATWNQPRSATFVFRFSSRNWRFLLEASYAIAYVVILCAFALRRTGRDPLGISRLLVPSPCLHDFPKFWHRRCRRVRITRPTIASARRPLVGSPSFARDYGGQRGQCQRSTERHELYQNAPPPFKRGKNYHFPKMRNQVRPTFSF